MHVARTLVSPAVATSAADGSRTVGERQRCDALALNSREKAAHACDTAAHGVEMWLLLRPAAEVGLGRLALTRTLGRGLEDGRVRAIRFAAGAASPCRLEPLAVASRVLTHGGPAIRLAVLVVLVLARAPQVGAASAGHVGEARTLAPIDAAADSLGVRLVPRVRRVRVRAEASRGWSDGLALGACDRSGPVHVEPGSLTLDLKRLPR